MCGLKVRGDAVDPHLSSGASEKVSVFKRRCI